MRNKSTKSALLSAAALALPFVLVSGWLCLTVAPYGFTRFTSGVLAGISLSIAVVILSRCLKTWGIAIGAVLYAVVLLLWLADAGSWYMQGSSFNERFFVNATLGNAQVGVEAYPWAILGALAAFACIVAAAVLLMVRTSRVRWAKWALLPAVALLALAATSDAPTHRMYAYYIAAEHSSQLAKSSEGAKIRAMLNTPTDPADVTASAGRNLVFVYLESIERTYTEQTLFPGLTPYINHWRKKGLDFSGFETFPGVTYTIAGIFSSQCGAPYLTNSIFGDDFAKLGFVPNNDSTSAESFHPELACLGDVLHAAGYNQTYLSGVDLSFANTDAFFRIHQYDRFLGKSQIEKLHGGKLPTEGWGLRDDDIFNEALREYQAREKTGQPFSIVFSTIDTHPPEGYVLPECSPYQHIHNKMLDAVHCTDQLLGRFLDELSHEPQWKNTVVVVMSDHVAMRNVASKYYPPYNQRQPLLFALNAGVGERPARMYHMDIAPTILAMLGVHSNVRFLAGSDKSSKSATPSPLPANRTAEAVVRNVLWSSHAPVEPCKSGNLVHWNAGGLTIGGRHVPLMRDGWPTDNVKDDHVLMLFVTKMSVEPEMVDMGTQKAWLAKARKHGRAVFLAMPFWNADGKRELALQWMAPNGAWASLGAVPNIQAVHLSSPRCDSMLAKLEAAAPGTRLPYASLFGTEPMQVHPEARPGLVTYAGLPAHPTPQMSVQYMYGRILESKDGAVPLRITYGRRIFLFPANGHDASVVFDVSSLQSMTLKPQINPLTKSCAAKPNGAVVGVRVLLDGKPATPRFIVNRTYHGDIQLPLHGAKRLRIQVDNGNGTMTCDWFSVGFSQLQWHQRPTNLRASGRPRTASSPSSAG